MKPPENGPARIPGLGLSELLPWLAVAGLTAVLFTPQTMSMIRVWADDSNYSHGFLIPLICAWLIWRQKSTLASLPVRPSLWGLLVVVPSLFALVLGKVGHEFYLQRVSLPPLLWGLSLLAFGWPLAKRCAFAAAYLLLMVPLPYILYDSVAFPLRLLAADLAGGVFRLWGVPVLVEGNVIHLPWITMNVIDACSGIRSLISLLAAGSILAYVMLSRRWLKPVVVLAVIPVAIVTNSARIVLAGYLSRSMGAAALAGSTHDMVGWVVFMAAFLILAGITWLAARLEPKGGGK